MSEYVSVAVIQRQEIPALFQGAIRAERVRFDDIISDRRLEDADRLVAIWESRERMPSKSLPSMLLGNDQVLADALAWSASFMKGVGPLSGIMRILSFAQIRNILHREIPLDTLSSPQLSSIIATVAGEALARQGRSASEASFSFESAINSLAFALFRSVFCGSVLSFSEIVSRWSFASGIHIDRHQDQISELIVDKVASVLSGSRQDDLFRNDSVTKRRSKALPATDLKSDEEKYIELTLDGVLPVGFWEGSGMLSPERALKIVDEFVPKLATMERLSTRARSLAIAKLFSAVTTEVDSQLALDRRALVELPEISFFLIEAMSLRDEYFGFELNGGVGWRVSTRVAEDFDVFSLPKGDVSWEEHAMRAGNSDGDRLPGTRSIEIFAGHSVARQSLVGAGPSRPSREEAAAAVAESEALDRVQMMLEEANSALHYARKVRRGRLRGT